MQTLRIGLAVALLCGCATTTPQYVVRPDPVIENTEVARDIEATISNYQAQEMDKEGARPLRFGEKPYGFDVQRIVDRVSRVTERPNLPYRVLVMESDEPNAAALADGRIYVSRGMLKYLGSRGSREDELAFVLGHELAHTVAQHLVKRYRQLQKQQLAMALVGMGTAAVTRGSEQGQQLGQMVADVANLVGEAVAMGYSQDQELEADQLGMRYLIRAKYDPKAALAMLEDFQRFDQPGIPFLRSHPPTQRRVEDIRRYLADTGYLPATAGSAQTPNAWTAPSSVANAPPASADPPRSSASGGRSEQRQRLLEAQKLYPSGSQSWKNIQQQLDALK